MSTKMTKALVFHVNVGQLPPYKAKAFIENLKDDIKDFLDALPDDCKAVFLPVRTMDTCIELINLT